MLPFINTAMYPKSDPGRCCTPRFSCCGGTSPARSSKWGASGTPPSAAPPRRGTPFVARRAVDLHGCAPAFRAPFPQIPAFEARCIRPGIVPLPRRTAVGTPRSGTSPEAAHQPSRCTASSGTEPWRPASLCPPFFLRRGYPRECSSSGSGAPPLLRRLRRSFPLRAPSMLSSRYVTVFKTRSIRGLMKGGCSCGGS